MPSVAAAPGPRRSLLSSLIYRPGGGNPLDFFTSMARTYGDVSSYRMAGERLFLVNDPRLIRDILVTHNRNFTKSRGLERSKRLLGEGLLTSEGAKHLKQQILSLGFSRILFKSSPLGLSSPSTNHYHVSYAFF